MSSVIEDLPWLTDEDVVPLKSKQHQPWLDDPDVSRTDPVEDKRRSYVNDPKYWHAVGGIGAIKHDGYEHAFTPAERLFATQKWLKGLSDDPEGQAAKTVSGQRELDPEMDTKAAQELDTKLRNSGMVARVVPAMAKKPGFAKKAIDTQEKPERMWEKPLLEIAGQWLSSAVSTTAKQGWQIVTAGQAKESSARVASGTADSKDYVAVASYLNEQESDAPRTVGDYIWNITTELPQYVVGLSSTRPLQKAVQKALTPGAIAAGMAPVAERSLIGQGMKQLPNVTKAVVRTPAVVGGEAVRALTPQFAPQIISGSEQRQVTPLAVATDQEGYPEQLLSGTPESPGAALAHSFAGIVVDNLTERMGEPIMKGLGKVASKMPMPNAVRHAAESASEFVRLAKKKSGALGELAKQSNIGGVVGEGLEERISEVAQGAMGISPDYGVTGDLLSGRFAKAAPQAIGEAAAFSLFPAGQFVAGAAEMGLAKRRQMLEDKAAMDIWKAGAPAAFARSAAADVARLKGPARQEVIQNVKDLSGRQKAEDFYDDPAHAYQWALNNPEKAQALVDGRRFGARSFESAGLPLMGGREGDKNLRREFFLAVKDITLADDETKDAFRAALQDTSYGRRTGEEKNFPVEDRGAAGTPGQAGNVPHGDGREPDDTFRVTDKWQLAPQDFDPDSDELEVKETPMGSLVRRKKVEEITIKGKSPNAKQDTEAGPVYEDGGAPVGPKVGEGQGSQDSTEQGGQGVHEGGPGPAPVTEGQPTTGAPPQVSGPSHGDSFFNPKALTAAREQSSKSRERLIYLSPSDFLKMAERVGSAVPSKQQTVQSVLESGGQFRDIPMLGFTHDSQGIGKVVSHEGRHRAMALEKLGVKEMPVRLNSQEGGKGSAIRWGEQESEGLDRISGGWPTVLRGETSGEIAFPVADMRVESPGIAAGRLVDSKARVSYNAKNGVVVGHSKGPGNRVIVKFDDGTQLGVAPRYLEELLPLAPPTSAPPGSKAKVDEMRNRLEHGQDLFNPQDVPVPEPAPEPAPTPEKPATPKVDISSMTEEEVQAMMEQRQRAKLAKLGIQQPEAPVPPVTPAPTVVPDSKAAAKEDYEAEKKKFGQTVDQTFLNKMMAKVPAGSRWTTEGDTHYLDVPKGGNAEDSPVAIREGLLDSADDFSPTVFEVADKNGNPVGSDSYYSTIEEARKVGEEWSDARKPVTPPKKKLGKKPLPPQYSKSGQAVMPFEGMIGEINRTEYIDRHANRLRKQLESFKSNEGTTNVDDTMPQVRKVLARMYDEKDIDELHSLSDFLEQADEINDLPDDAAEQLTVPSESRHLFRMAMQERSDVLHDEKFAREAEAIKQQRQQDEKDMEQERKDLEELESKKGLKKKEPGPAPAPEPTKGPPTIRDKAEAAKAEYQDEKKKFLDALKDLGLSSVLPGGIDPRLIGPASKLISKAIKADVLTFAAFVNDLAKSIGRGIAIKLGPNLRFAWDDLREVFTQMDESRPIEDILSEGEQSGTNEPTPKGEGAGSKGTGGARGPGTGTTGLLEGTPPGDVSAPPKAEDAGRPDTGGGDELRGPGVEGDLGGDRAGRSGEDVPGRAPDGAGESLGSERGIRSGDPIQRNRANYHLTDPEKVVGGGAKAKFARNKRSIEIVGDIEANNRQPTADELDVLAGYTGWGAFGENLFKGTWDYPRPKKEWQEESDWLRANLTEAEWKSAQDSIVNAHYTSPEAALGMWEMARLMGFNGGRILEPAVGNGMFLSTMPRDLMDKSQITGIDKDVLSVKISKLLHPNASIHEKGYEQSKTPDNFYRLVMSNVPFLGGITVPDRRYSRFKAKLHNYYFLKAMDQVEPGGLVMFITTNFTMDGKGSARQIRKQLSTQADFVSAFRFPSGAFSKIAGTKVVADLIILRKHREGESTLPTQAWSNVVNFDTPNGEKIDVNEYWINNPQNVLGTLTYGTGTTTGTPGMVVDMPDDLNKLWQQAVQSVPEGIVSSTVEESADVRPNETKARQNTVTIKDGQPYVVRGEHLVPLIEVVKWKQSKWTDKAVKDRADQIAKLADLRDKLSDVFDARRLGTSTADARAALNTAYDDYVENHGFITGSEALKVFTYAKDPLATSIASLESKTAEGGYEKRPIFLRDVNRGISDSSKLTVGDAFAVQRNESIELNIDRIAELSKTTPEQVRSELEAGHTIYKTPTGYEAADRFVSGNVRRKAREIEAAIAEGVTGLEDSLNAVKAVIPEDVPYTNIDAKLGATWVESKDYRTFLANLAGGEEGDYEVSRLPTSWKIPADQRHFTSDGARTWGFSAVPWNRMLEAAFNNTSLRLTYEDDDGNRYFDEAASTLANAKVESIRDEFKLWIWKDPDRVFRLSSAYNELVNAFSDPQWDGSHLSFEGLVLELGNDAFSFRQHQANAVWRGMVRGKGIYGHEVGTGKTFTIGGLAIESKRLGLAKKPFLLAHNANSETVARDIQAAWPGRKILYINNLNAAERDLNLAQIALDDWDLVVLPHSLVGRMQLRPETIERLIQAELDALDAAAREVMESDDSVSWGKSIKELPDDMNTFNPDDLKLIKNPTAKELVKERLALRAKVTEAALLAEDANTVFFEDMGIDMMLVDEAHAFKKLTIASKMNIKGLNKGSSDRGSSVMLLADYIREINNGRGVHLFTGTPITNTMNELYNMMRLTMAEEMERDGYKSWDGWFNNFAEAVSDVELSSGGVWDTVERLSAFVNVPELWQVSGQVMDVVFADQMKEFAPRPSRDGISEIPVGRPYKEVHVDVADMTPWQKSIQDSVRDRWLELKAARGRDKRDMLRRGSPNHPLRLENEGKANALDPRFVNMAASGTDKRLKVNRMIRTAMRHYHDDENSSQMIFMEMGFTGRGKRSLGKDAQGNKIVEDFDKFNLAQHIKERFMAVGVPESEIAIFSGMDKEDRVTYSEGMRQGTIRIAIGSTETMGTGVNAQTWLRAVHHLDAPWNPGLLEQRNGRFWRQGNKWNTIHEYRYLTEASHDGRRWQVLLTKMKFISDYMRKKGTGRTMEGDAVEIKGDFFEDTFSEAAGDPRILLKAKLRKDIAKLERKQDQHASMVQDATQRMQDASDNMDVWDQYLKGIDKDIATIKDNTVNEQFSMKIDGKIYSDKNAARDALIESSGRHSKAKENAVIGEYRGMELRVVNKNLTLTNPSPSRISSNANRIWDGEFLVRKGRILAFKGDRYIPVEWTVNSIDSMMRGLPEEYRKATQWRVDDETYIAQAHDLISRPFDRIADLEKKRQQLQVVTEEMDQFPTAAPSWFRNTAPPGSAVWFQHVMPFVGEEGKEFLGKNIASHPGPQQVAPYLQTENPPLQYTVKGHRVEPDWPDNGGKAYVLAQDEKENLILLDSANVTDEYGTKMYEHAGPPEETGDVEEVEEYVPVDRRSHDDHAAGHGEVGGVVGGNEEEEVAGPRGAMKQTLSYGAPTRAVDKPVSKANVIASWKAIFDLRKLGVGRFSRRNGFKAGVRAGIYKPGPETVRIQQDYWLSTGLMAHEIAHHLDKTLDMTGNPVLRGKGGGKIPAAELAELELLDYDPKAARDYEGWAEYIRHFLVEDDATTFAPLTDVWFRAWLDANPKIKDKFTRARKIAKDYSDQGTESRTIADTVPPAGEARATAATYRETLPRRLTTAWDRFYGQWKDQNNLLRKIQEKVASQKPGFFDRRASAYELKSSFDLTSVAHLEKALYEGVHTVTENRSIISQGLQGVISELEKFKEYDDGVQYAIAKHVLELHVLKPDYEPGMELRDAQHWEDKIENQVSPEAKARAMDFAAALTDFNNGLIMMAADAGRISQEEAKQIIAAYQYYIPLHREGEKGQFAKTIFAGAKTVNLGRAVHRRSMRGSGQRVIDPVEATMRRGIRLYSQALATQVIIEMVHEVEPQLGGAEGMGEYMERVDPSNQATRFRILDIVDKLIDEGIVDPDFGRQVQIISKLRNGDHVTGKDIDWLAHRFGVSLNSVQLIRDLVDATKNEVDALAIATLWHKDYSPDNRKSIARVIIGGTPLMYEMHPELYSLFAGLDPWQMSVGLQYVAGAMRVLKTGAVAASTAFAVQNVPADLSTFAVKSKYVKAAKLLTEPLVQLKAYVAYKAGQKNEAARIFDEYGGRLYNQLGYTAASQKRAVRSMRGTHTLLDKVMAPVLHPVQTFGDVESGVKNVISMSDVGPRLAEMIGALNDLGWELRDREFYNKVTGNKETPGRWAIVKAMNAAGDVTVNFKRRGSIGQKVDALWFPFFNPMLEGLDNTARELGNLSHVFEKGQAGERARRFVLRMGVMAAGSLGYALSKVGAGGAPPDDRYLAMDQDEKYKYWHFTWDGQYLFSMKKSQSFSWLSNMIEASVESHYRNDKRALIDAGLYEVKNMMVPGVTPVIAEPVRQVGNIQRNPGGRPMVPEYLSSQPLSEQFTPNTSELAKWMSKLARNGLPWFPGDALVKSPIRLEHAINAFTGNAFRRGSTFLEDVAEGKVDVGTFPAVRAVIRREYLRDAEDFYGKMGDINTQFSQIKQLETEDARKEVATKHYQMQDYAALMTRIRQVEPHNAKGARTYEYEKYIAGLARKSLGEKELASYPNPLKLANKDMPKELAQVVGEWRVQRYRESTQTYPKSTHKGDASYKDTIDKWKWRINAAAQILE